MSGIFKAYDVRGVYPEELTKNDAYKIGVATVRFLMSKNPGKKQLTLVVGEDCRFSSPDLRGAVIDAMTRAGARVKYIGFCTTPLFYFSVNKLKADGGIMVTASHNPPQYGGLKIVGPESRPIGAESGLKDIEALSRENFDLPKQVDEVEEVSTVNDYVDFLLKESKIGLGENKLKMVIDAGNGMTPIALLPLLQKLKLKYTPLFFDIDCNFPNHTPDISKTEALNDLRRKVLETESNIGIAFDGDGDRVFFVDENGETVKSEFVLALLYDNDNSGSFFSKPKAVYDIRVSRSVKELIGSKGFRSRPGHSFIKKVMKDNDAKLGGELSGHFFFKEMKYAESSILAMLKIIKIMHNGSRPLSKLVKPYQKYFHSGEINTEVASREMIVEIVKRLKEKYKDGRIDELDGITVEYPNWWFNVRASNTEPILRLVVEADTEILMRDKTRELNLEIKKDVTQIPSSL